MIMSQQVNKNFRRKIVCCMYKYFPFGGLSRDFLKIKKEFEKFDYEVVLYVSKVVGMPPKTIKYKILTPTGLTNHEKARVFSNLFLEEMKQIKPLVIIGFNKMPGLDFYYAADICYEYNVNKKNIVERFFYKLTPRYKQFKKLEESVFGSFSKTNILFLDSTQKERYQKIYDLSSKCCHVLGPGVDLGYKYNIISQKINRKKIREDLEVGEDEILLIQVGSDFKRKGVDRSLKAIAYLKEHGLKHIKFVVIGKDSNVNLFKKKANDLNVSKEVIFIEGVNGVEKYLQAADMLLHPAYAENTGTVIIEGIAAGMPVIVTASCGYAHYVHDWNVGGVVDEPFKQKRFNEVVLEYVINKKLYSETKKRAIERSRDSYLYKMPSEIVNRVIEWLKQQK